MRATDFEFRNRFWLIGMIFGLGFFCYTFDHVNAGAALVRAIAGSGLDLDSPRGRHELQAVFGVAALLVAASAMVRTWATAYLNTEVVHDANLRTEALVADGPYRYVRNPLYFANVVMTLGMGLMASRLGWVMLVVLHLIFLHRLIGREEEELLLTQGERYRKFCNAVPRLFPSLTPRLPSGGIKALWGQAWLSEAFFFWGFTAATAAFAFTLKFGYAAAVFGLCMFVFIVALPLWRKKIVT